MKVQSRWITRNLRICRAKPLADQTAITRPPPLAHPPTSTRTYSGVDVRHDPAIEQVVAFLKTRAVRSTVVADGIIGCPTKKGWTIPKESIVLSALLGGA